MRGSGKNGNFCKGPVTVNLTMMRRYLSQDHRGLAFTDGAITFDGLSKQALRGPAHRSLLMHIGAAAALDIAVPSHWHPSSENPLADALSRSDNRIIADTCLQ